VPYSTKYPVIGIAGVAGNLMKKNKRKKEDSNIANRENTINPSLFNPFFTYFYSVYCLKSVLFFGIRFIKLFQHLRLIKRLLSRSNALKSAIY